MDGRVLCGRRVKRPYEEAKNRVGVAPRLRADAKITGSRYVYYSVIAAHRHPSIDMTLDA